MTEPDQSTRAAKVNQFLRHIGKRDLDEAVRLLSPDVTYDVHANHALSGTFSGRDAVVGHLVEIERRTAGRFDPFKEEDVMVGIDHVCVLVDIRMQAEGRIFRGRHLILMRFDRHDMIDHVAVFVDNEAAATRFYGPRMTQSP